MARLCHRLKASMADQASCEMQSALLARPRSGAARLSWSISSGVGLVRTRRKSSSAPARSATGRRMRRSPWPLRRRPCRIRLPCSRRTLGRSLRSTGKATPVTGVRWGQFENHAGAGFLGPEDARPLRAPARRIPSRCRSPSARRLTASCPINCSNSCASSGAATIRGSTRSAIRSMAAPPTGR